MGNITDPEILNKVNYALDQLRPFLEADGGDIELIDISDDFIARVKLLGACSSCSMSEMTLKAGVEEALKKAVPEIRYVESV
jgi:Fe-S cluster biogenesis protein NfuA